MSRSRLLAALLFFGFWMCASVCDAAEVPRAAIKHRGDLTREARMVWGLDAPVPVFAAQIHQESGWNPAAVSRVGALGMAQFMPATVRWISGLVPGLAAGMPTNPVWAIRALVNYDYWLFERVRGASELDKHWAALRSYNGGLGWWQQEAKLASSAFHDDVDAQCGRGRRSAAFCPENLAYPRRILHVLQPIYRGWGRMVGV